MAKRLRDFGFLSEASDDGDGAAAPKPKLRPSNGDKKKQVTADHDEAEEETPPSPARDIAAPEFEISKFHNGNLEFITLVRCVMDPQLQIRLWPRLLQDHFAADTTSAIFKRLQTLHQSGREWPKLAMLARDPALPAGAQAQLNTVVSRADKGKPLVHGSITLATGFDVPMETVGDFEGHVFDLLESYRITRKAAESFVSAINEIADDEAFDPFTGPALVEKAAAEVLAIRGQESIAENLLHFGHQTSEEDAAQRNNELRKMFQEDLPRFKTGIDNLDERSGGFQAGEIVLLGANSGGGKTAAALSMMVNMARTGTSAAMLQLELSMQQIDERLACHLADISSEFMRAGRLTTRHQERIQRAWDDFDAELKTAKTRFTVFAPSSQTVSGCEMVFKQFPYQVWFIDYASLIDLGGDDADLKGWEKLSRVTKLFKSMAKKYHICIVILVQINLDKDGNAEVRYAKAMREDADIVIYWHMTEEAKQEGVVWWKHLKARQYEPFDFMVKCELEYFRFATFRESSASSTKKRKLGKSLVQTKDKLDQVVDEAAQTFHKKDKPLIAASPTTTTASLIADLEGRAPKKAVSVDDEDTFDEEG